MNSWKRLLPYMLLNILVSACTTLAVVYTWDRIRTGSVSFLPSGESLAAEAPPETQAVDLAPPPAPTPSYTLYQVTTNQTLSEIADQFGIDLQALLDANGIPEDQVLGAGEALLIPATPIPTVEAQVEVVGVIGAGDLGSERVVIRQFGEGQASLQGWQLQDSGGATYTFPGLQLAKDGSQVELFSRAGVDSAAALYWNLEEPTWQPGDTISLRDAQGTLRSSYTVP